MKEISLLQLAKSKTWIKQESGSRIKYFDPDTILYKIKINKHDTGIVTRVILRIGIDVAKKINVSPGDRINIFYHPDDIMSCMIIKSTSMTGYLVNFESKSKVKLRTSFIWKRPVLIDEMKITKAEYIHIPEKNMILFRIVQ